MFSAEEGVKKRRNLSVYRERLGYPVVNSNKPTEIVLRLQDAVNQQFAALTAINHDDWVVPEKLVGQTVRLLFKISHLKGTEPGEFNGMFIGKEYHGGPHPWLLIPADEVSFKSKEVSQNL